MSPALFQYAADAETARACERLATGAGARFAKQQAIAAAQRAEFRALLRAGQAPRRKPCGKQYKHPRELTPKIKAEMVTLRRAGKSLREVEEITGYCRATVVRHTRGWRVAA
jgi:DNA invertase Pin-like site-specific DNA recombinase